MELHMSGSVWFWSSKMLCMNRIELFAAQVVCTDLLEEPVFIFSI